MLRLLDVLVTQGRTRWMNQSSEKMNGNLTLVLGGAASGKSAFAEDLVYRLGGKRIYLATAQTFDAEMERKIAAHVAQRGAHWHTIEEPIDVGPILTNRHNDEVVLLDCATLWLTNVILSGRDLHTEVDTLMSALAHCPCPVVIVSNEVGHGIVPENAMAREFRAAQGALNQKLAAASHCAVFITAGLPQLLRGALPA